MSRTETIKSIAELLAFIDEHISWEDEFGKTMTDYAAASENPSGAETMIVGMSERFREIQKRLEIPSTEWQAWRYERAIEEAIK